MGFGMTTIRPACTMPVFRLDGIIYSGDGDFLRRYRANFAPVCFKGIKAIPLV
ncbi:hypothetical protein KCP78_24105 [Salmonella enterica subsp. enterica]|nr:hypothetical protein KCP78_24105 [Salmonella enterica subsp. enterica]